MRPTYLRTSTEMGKYEGWTNRETWAVSLHLSNTEDLYLELLEVVKDGVDGKHRWAIHSNPKAGVVQRVAEGLESYVEGLFEPVYHAPGEWVPKTILLMAKEVGSTWRVNWRELAEAYIELDKVVDR